MDTGEKLSGVKLVNIGGGTLLLVGDAGLAFGEKYSGVNWFPNSGV